MIQDFILYSSIGCHLCEQALEICQQLAISVQVVDIVEDDKLVSLYGTHIPVLERKADQQQLFWPFTAQQIRELI